MILETINELGGKCVPEKFETTAQAAVQFAGKGINSLRSIPLAREEVLTGDTLIDLPEAELVGSVCIGNLLFAQGLELLLKLVFIAEKLPDAGYGQHDLLKRFNAVCGISPLKENIDKFMPSRSENKLATAQALVSAAESSFMISRYIGLKKSNLNSIDVLDATGLLIAITISYQGLGQVEAFRLIGIDIKNEDGDSVNSATTKVGKV